METMLFSSVMSFKTEGTFCRFEGDENSTDDAGLFLDCSNPSPLEKKLEKKGKKKRKEKKEKEKERKRRRIEKKKMIPTDSFRSAHFRSAHAWFGTD